MKNIIYDMMVQASQKFIGPLMRNAGRKMYQTGTKIHGDHGSQDRLVPSLRNLQYQGQKPSIQATDFVAPNATVLNNVSAGFKSSIWYSSVLIGTQGITIGNNTVLQDRVHASKQVTIGDNVFIGPNCILQGSNIQSRAFVSMGATIKHATVQKGSFVAAGAVVEDGQVVKQGEVWAGNPAKFLRLITPLEREVIHQHLEEMQDLACIHSEQTEKSIRQLLNGQVWAQTATFDEFTENLLENPTFSYTQTDEQYSEQRTLLKEKLQYPQIANDYEPYAFDMSKYSQKFNVGVHQQDVKRVATKIKQKEYFENDTKPWSSPF